MMSHWIYDRSPVEGLRFEEPLAQLKQELAVSVSTSISMSILLTAYLFLRGCCALVLRMWYFFVCFVKFVLVLCILRSLASPCFRS
jgi:hypothetical protein